MNKTDIIPIGKFSLIGLLLVVVAACKPAPEDTKKAPNIPLISTTNVQTQSLAITEDAIGNLEGLIDPTLASEVNARIIKVHVNVGDKVKPGQLIASLDAGDYAMQKSEAQAEVARIQAQLDHQAKTVARSQALVDKKFISQNAVDSDLAQQTILTEQLAGAKARINTINHNGNKTHLYAPVAGVIEKKIAGTGEFVRIGDPIVQIIGNQKLRAHIPFPESIAGKMKAGLTIKLTTPTSSGEVITTIKEIKPVVMAENRSIDVIADVSNQPDWQAGASVNAQVILSQKENVLVVPEQSIVLRPAGEVVYVIKNNQAHQRIVTTGERKAGMVEVLSGLETGLEVAVDGASYLTDNAEIKIAPPEDNVKPLPKAS